jgi:hypothetical protein
MSDTGGAGVFAKTKFRGVAHRVLPGIGFIKPEDPAGVDKFFEINGGKWKKPDSRELFFHESHVVGAAVRKDDTVEFTLSADPTGKFGERTVQAREIEGGSGGRVEVKLAELEKAALADRETIEGLVESAQKQQEAIETLMKYAVKVGVLENKFTAMEQTVTSTITESVSRGMEAAIEKFQKKTSEAARHQLEAEGSADGEPRACMLSDAEVSTEEPKSSEDQPQEKKPKKNKKKIGKSYNFTPSGFQALKANLGLGLLMMLLLIVGQFVAGGYVYGCGNTACGVVGVKLSHGRSNTSRCDGVGTCVGHFRDRFDQLGSHRNEAFAGKDVFLLDSHSTSSSFFGKR